MNFCIDCKHYRARFDADSDGICVAPEVERGKDLVQGGDKPAFCSVQRSVRSHVHGGSLRGVCGEEGQYFEPKEDDQL